MQKKRDDDEYDALGVPEFDVGQNHILIFNIVNYIWYMFSFWDTICVLGVP